MDHGDIGVTPQDVVVFVFDGLVATLKSKRAEHILLMAAQWRRALDLWAFQVQVCDWMHRLMSQGLGVEVITWHSPEFALVLHDRLWSMDLPVQETSATEYRFASPSLATERSVLYVYDPDPAHRHGYGFKGRAFSPTLGAI